MAYIQNSGNGPVRNIPPAGRAVSWITSSWITAGTVPPVPTLPTLGGNNMQGTRTFKVGDKVRCKEHMSRSSDRFSGVAKIAFENIGIWDQMVGVCTEDKKMEEDLIFQDMEIHGQYMSTILN